MSSGASFKVAVLNYSGNVGKSTLARHLLQPRMGDCPIMFVESINEGGDETNVHGKDFASLMVTILGSDGAIVDIGSSNIEEVFSKVEELADMLDVFDFFLIPTVPMAKQQADTVKVLHDLVGLGVNPARLKIVLNQVERRSNVEKTFEPVLKATSNLGVEYAVVHSSEGFSHLGNTALKKVAAFDRDFRSEIAAAPTKAKKHELASAMVFSRMAQTIDREFDKAFETLFATV